MRGEEAAHSYPVHIVYFLTHMPSHYFYFFCLSLASKACRYFFLCFSPDLTVSFPPSFFLGCFQSAAVGPILQLLPPGTGSGSASSTRVGQKGREILFVNLCYAVRRLALADRHPDFHGDPPPFSFSCGFFMLFRLLIDPSCLFCLPWIM